MNARNVLKNSSFMLPKKSYVSNKRNIWLEQKMREKLAHIISENTEREKSNDQV